MTTQIGTLEDIPVTMEPVTIANKREAAVKWGNVKFTVPFAQWHLVKDKFIQHLAYLVAECRKKNPNFGKLN